MTLSAHRLLNIAVSLGTVLVVWAIVSGFKLVNPALFPTPVDTYSAAVELMRSGLFVPPPRRTSSPGCAWARRLHF